MMINKGMDVNDLVNSEIFFPRIWKNLKYFSSNRETQMASFNGQLLELGHMYPSDFFKDERENTDDQV